MSSGTWHCNDYFLCRGMEGGIKQNISNATESIQSTKLHLVFIMMFFNPFSRNQRGVF